MPPALSGLTDPAKRQILLGLFVQKWSSAQIEAALGLDIPGFATGGSFVTTTRRLIQVGENGPERVTVRPMGHRSEGAGGATNVFNGPVFFDDIALDKFQRGNLRALEREGRRL